MSVRVRRTNMFTEFACFYESATKTGTKTEAFAIIRVQRIFHPVRGEEVQIELEAGQIYRQKSARDDKKVKRTDRHIGQMTAPPHIGEQIACAVMGKMWAPPADAKPGTPVAILMQEANEYTQRNYEKLSEREAMLVRNAFQGGYDYRDSLGPPIAGSTK